LTDNSENQQDNKQQQYPINSRDIFRILMSLLGILVVGYFVIMIVGYYELAGTDGELDTEKVMEWTENGLSSFPISIKFAAMVIQASMIIPLIIYFRKRELSVFKYLRIRPISKKYLLYSAVIGVSITVLGDEMGRLMDMILPIPESMFEGMRRLLAINNIWDFLTIGITVTLIAPIIEELFFRGLLQRYFEATKGVTTGVLIASAIFGAIHFNIYMLLPILIMATIMGAMAWRVESVFPAMLVHCINNTTSLVSVNLYETEPSWYVMGSHVSPLVIIVALGAMIWALRKFFMEAESDGLGGHGPRGDIGTKLNQVV
jgi:CAAX protease family protein